MHEPDGGSLLKSRETLFLRYFFVTKEVSKKASLAAMAGFIAILRLRSAQAPGRALLIDQISRAYDGKVVSIVRKEPGLERAEPVSATVSGRLV
jgi:hypothetical protein